MILKKIKSGYGLDIGCGSGAISISINKLNEDIKMLGVDISGRALKVANKNKKNDKSKFWWCYLMPNLYFLVFSLALTEYKKS